FFSSRRRHTRSKRDWSSDVCSSDLEDRVRKLRLGVALDRADLSGRTLLSLDLHRGLGENLGGMDNGSSLSSRAFAGADNDFTKRSEERRVGKECCSWCAP